MERATDCGSGEDLQQNNVDAAPSARSNMPAVEVPGELGDYELLEEVGRGGQGVVFRARQKSLNRIVASKSHWSWSMGNQSASQSASVLEAEAAASLDHPCIVPIYEVGERDGQCYFSMKFVEGGQLDEVVKQAPFQSGRQRS